MDALDPKCPDPLVRRFHATHTDAVEDLLLWRNPSQSAAVLGGITLGFWVLNVVAYNPVVVLATVAQFAVLACFLANVACSALKRWVDVLYARDQLDATMTQAGCASARVCL